MFINIANDMMVRASEYNGHTMLHLFGAFKDKQLSDTKVRIILEHAKELTSAISAWTEGGIALSDTLSIICSTWNNNKMIELVGEFKSSRLSVNLIQSVLKYGKELTKVLQDNTPEIVLKDATLKAQYELQKNSAAIGTDRKSAKNKKTVLAPVVESVAPVMPDSHLSVESYLTDVLHLSMSNALKFAHDAKAIASYNTYLDSERKLAQTRSQENDFDFVVSQAQMTTSAPTTKASKKAKGLTVQEMSSVSPAFAQSQANIKAVESMDGATQAEKRAHYAAKKNAPAPVAQEKKGRGIPVSFSVQIKGNEHPVIEDNKTRAMNNLADKVLERVTIRNGVQSTEQKRVMTVNRDTSSPAHYFDELVRQRYIFNVKEL